ncbi:uncharacterized protein EAE97_001739 [Botrytis byssoidea]|uniref:Uncharacterized protein n=1 Tax=Botrytis byssoidea TaxID=139641 RepID=A0A9P5IYD6_9HELO|nr:uncharacterized protein EAE97_001739 [Botrytis byssoidea]KAF7952242.1 hypothetical protein EAE97_001739 [Botrytis byssoidea]
MAAVPPPGDDDKWAPGFELPIPSAEGADKKYEDKTVPTKKAETIRGTATVNQPGPDLAERPEQETTAEYFESWAEAERMMRADLEKGKFTAEQVDEIRRLMEAGAIKMKLPYKKAPGEMTIAQWEEKAAKLEDELKNKGEEGDKYVAQLMALQDQLRKSEVANLEMETRNAKLDKERKEAMAKIDKAAQEKRDKKDQENKDKEDARWKAEAEKHAQALREKDKKFQALKKEVDALSKRIDTGQEQHGKKDQEDKAKEAEKRKAEAEKHAKALREKDDKIRVFERNLDALSKRAEAEKKEREKAAAKEKEKDKRVEILQIQALEKDEKIKKLEKDLEEEKHKNDLEEAGYHGDDELEAIIKRLEHEKEQLKRETAKLKDVISGFKKQVRALESSQARFLDAAINEEQRGKERDDLEVNVVELKRRVEQYIDEEKIQIERERVLKLDRQTLGAQVVRKQEEITQLNEELKQSKERITACESTIHTLQKAVDDSSGTLGREFVVLEEEIKKLGNKVKERDVRISQQQTEIGAQKTKIGEQALKIRIGTPGASHGELALQNQAIFKENTELKKKLEDMEKNQGAGDTEELRRQLEASQRQLEASQKEYAVVQERVEKLLQELEEVRKTKFGDGANASEIERLKQEVKKAAEDIQKLTHDTRKAVGEINRLKKENAAGTTTLQTITKELSKATSEISRLNDEKEEATEMIRHLKEENEAHQFEIGRLRSLRPKVQVHASQKELEYNKIKVGHYQEKEYQWRIEKDELEAQAEEHERQIQELITITKQSEDIVSEMTVEQTELQKIVEQLKLELAAAPAKPVDDAGGVGEAPADAAERERVHAEKIKELTDQNSALSKQVDALKGEIEKIRKGLTGAHTDAEKEKNQLSQQQAQASAQAIHMLMGFMILQRALNGKVNGDMDRVLAAVDQARVQAEAVGDEKLIVEVSYLAAIAVYYEGDTPKALESFNAVKDSKDWDDARKDLVKKWIAQCEKGADCPKGRSGYREALGLGPVPPSFRAPPKAPKDDDDEEAKKAREEAKKARKEAKKAKKVAKRAAKKFKTGTKPRRASAPRSRGIHRPDLYVGILSPRQQQIWDTIDFSDFDYNHLTPEQQSLFSFFPIDSEPESPRRPVVHRGAGPSSERPPTPARRPVAHRGAGPSSELSPLPTPRAHFGLPPLPPSGSDSGEGAPPPPPPPPPGPPRPPGKNKPPRPASSAASSAASAQAAQGAQEEQPSRMSRPTTDAALHIQYLVAQLAESGRRIRELEPAGATVETLTGRVQRRDKQIEDLKLFSEQVLAENIALKGDAQ